MRMIEPRWGDQTGDKAVWLVCGRPRTLSLPKLATRSLSLRPLLPIALSFPLRLTLISPPFLADLGTLRWPNRAASLTTLSET